MRISMQTIKNRKMNIMRSVFIHITVKKIEKIDTESEKKATNGWEKIEVMFTSMEFHWKSLTILHSNIIPNLCLYLN